MTRKKGSAVWSGSVKEGKGTISTETGALRDAPYGFKARFEGGPGTNPEEILGAAHAGCFSMALSKALGEDGMTAESIETTATVTLDKVGEAFKITRVHLDVHASIPGADASAFDKAARAAKEGCPVSQLFNAEISMEARLN